jgi:hypothetical protein
VEAKKADLIGGWGQLATQKFNLAKRQEIPTIYGSVTTVSQWQFLKLTGRDLTIDATDYPLKPIDRILGIFKWMVEN